MATLKPSSSIRSASKPKATASITKSQGLPKLLPAAKSPAIHKLPSLAKQPAAQRSSCVGTEKKALIHSKRIPSSEVSVSADSKGPLNIKEADTLLRKLTQGELCALADTRDEVEQLPVCVLLEFVGDKDYSWENARTSLQTGLVFVKEILDMKEDQFITRRAIDRMEKIGLGEINLQELKLRTQEAPSDIAPGNLQRMSAANRDHIVMRRHTAYVLASYLVACVRKAKERHGIVDITSVAAEDAVPSWPKRANVKDILDAVGEAVKCGKTPLLICDGHANEVDTFFHYKGFVTIEATHVLKETVLNKTRSVEDTQFDLNRKFVAGVTHGRPIHIAMGRTALQLKETYCKGDLFPAVVFNNKLLKQDFADRMNAGCFSLVTTDFSLDAAQEHLPTALPHFEDMAIIIVEGFAKDLQVA